MHTARVWEKVNHAPVNERRRKMINKLFDGFERKLTSSKHAKIAKCSEDTASRDIRALIKQEFRVGGKRSLQNLCVGWTA